MGTILDNVTRYYRYINDDLADTRTNSFWLVFNPIPICVIMFLYHRFVHSWGPQLMADRPAYKLKNTIIVYNIVQIFLSGLMTVKCMTWLYLPGYYNIWCQKINYEDTEVERMVIDYVWLYYVIKIIDLLDTVFFVLRKKFNQVTFLHVYHHLGMCLLGFIGTKFVPVLQLQFLLLILHFGHVIFEPSCAYPKWVSFVFLPHNIFILILFTDFYIKEYIYKKKK
nr:elongation of very long chain fatty acids protein 4-like [Vanessa tameamea]